MKTQTEAFWRDEFQVSDEDAEFLYASFLESEAPRSLEELAVLLVGRQLAAERTKVAAEMARGQIYRPEDTHQVGQELVFSAYDYAVAKVLSVRPGRNPRHGPFSVIEVQLEGFPEAHEFASAFAEPHPLNYSADLSDEDDAGELGVDQILELYGDYVLPRTSQTLENDSELVHLDGLWFLRSLLPEIHVGHLNIAEAMIHMAQRPLSSNALLLELDLPEEANQAALRFALDLALAEDERFDEILTKSGRTWYLFSLEPQIAVTTPWRLEQAYAPADEASLLGELAEFVREIGDELDERPAPATSPTDQSSASFILNFPHWREGTLPLTRDVLGLLPDDIGARFPITFQGERGGQSMPGWALLEERYVCGLTDWYREQDVSVGSTLTVERTDNPMVLTIGFERRPRRGEWIKEAAVSEGRLVFEMQRRAYTSRYDRTLVLHVEDVEALDALAFDAHERDDGLFSLMIALAPELIKLSSNSVFHAKTLYGAVNLLRRSGAIPIYAELTRRACFDPVGAGNWTFDPDLRDVVYGTEEEMRNRPQSRRADLMRDIVVPC